ncbi:MAG TPA: sodium/proline symporter [bacterium]|nr:sodium/proline symporter [bacterium]
MTALLVGFIVYLVLMLTIGAITWRLNRSTTDYYLGGRTLGPWLTAFSERTSGESAWLLLGLPGAALALGLIEVWTAVGCVSGIMFSWYVIAERLRVETERYNAITLPEYLAARFGRHARSIRSLAMLIIVFFFTFYLAAQMNGAGKVLNVTFDLPQRSGILIGAAIIVLYTMMGGFLAVVWTDLVQAILMIATLVILPVVALFELSAQGISLGDAMTNAGTVASLTGGKAGWAGAAAVIGGLSWGLGYMGQPHLLTKFMAIRTPQEIRVGRRIAFAWAVPAFTGAIIIGLAALALHGGAFYGDRERVMPALATELFPGWLAGILISGAIAAMMSTADSQLLVISSAVIEDFYRKTLKRELSDRAMVTLSRLITLTVGIAGILLALYSDKLIFAMVSYAWSGLGSSFGPAILLTLLWKKTSGPGIIAGMLTGAITTVVWSSIPALDGLITARLVSFVLAVAAIIVVSSGRDEKAL